MASGDTERLVDNHPSNRYTVTEEAGSDLESQLPSAVSPEDSADNASGTATAHSEQRLQIDRITHPVFVFAYLANLTLVTANAAMFIFADWVEWLSTQGQAQIVYVEELPGRIVREGLIAAICARLVLGMSIDYFGVRIVWICMGLLTLFGAGLFASMSELTWQIYAARMCFVVGVSGMFTCGNFHIQNSVLEQRRTEFIALLGSSGFAGMIVGAQAAALLLRLGGTDRAWAFQSVFALVITSMVLYLILIQFCLRGLPSVTRTAIRPSLIRLTRQYWPGLVVVMAMAMGLTFTVTSLYLVRFNRHAGLGGIGTFWTTYAICAFVFRLRTASLSRRVGRYRLITLGLAIQGLGIWALVPCSQWWHLMGSAALCGLGHALLFPSIVSLGSGVFPPQYRGSGTNLILGCLDLGAAFSAPVLCRIIDLPMFDGVGFRPMFMVAGTLPLLLAAGWQIRHWSTADPETVADPPETDSPAASRISDPAK